MIPQSHIQQTMDSCTEAKLKITKFIETYDKSSPTQLSAQFFLDQLDVLDHIEYALLSNFFSVNSDDVCDQLAVKMWRNIIYPQIDYIRRVLTASKDENERRNLAQQLDTAILGHLGRIGNLIASFTAGKRDKFDSGAFLIGEFEEWQRKLLVRLFTFSGDLLRYRCSNNNIFGHLDKFQSAKEFYELGHRVNPFDGSIFNQLAVIESLSATKSIPMMIYLYSRALGSVDPFPIAKENLGRLLKKFGSLFSGLVDILDEIEPSPSDFDKMFSNYPGEEHLLYASAVALSKFMNVNIPIVDFENVKMKFEMLLLANNDNIVIDANNFDMKFVSTLIGSSFIKESIQIEILKVFNPNPAAITTQLTQSQGYFKPPSQHESVQLPLSQ